MRRFNWDRAAERAARRIAGRTSRRSFIGKLGAILAAAPVFPLLPVDRAFGAEAKAESDKTMQKFARSAQSKDDTLCNYWRYCAIDGFLCSCCGGGVHTCPAGSEPSPTSWIGTCLHPDDQKLYLVAYRDCCGNTGCGSCYCLNTERETPVYRPQGNNDIVWCFGTSGMTYHCSMAALVGLAE